MSENDAADEKAKFLEQALAAGVTSFDSRRLANKNKAFLSKILSISFSTLTTILLGWQGVPDKTLITVKNVALLLSACVTIVAAWDAFFNHRELWVRYTSTANRLKAIQSDLNYLLAGTPNPNPEKLDELYGRYHAVLDETNASWQDLRKEQSPKATR
jgi:ABC-type multidrug transport system fused ATPase/permease subunit